MLTLYLKLFAFQCFVRKRIWWRLIEKSASYATKLVSTMFYCLDFLWWKTCPDFLENDIIARIDCGDSPAIRMIKGVLCSGGGHLAWKLLTIRLSHTSRCQAPFVLTESVPRLLARSNELVWTEAPISYMGLSRIWLGR